MSLEVNKKEEEDLVIVISDDEKCFEKDIEKEHESTKSDNEDDLIELFTVHQNPRKFTTYYNDDELKVSAVRSRWNVKFKTNPNLNLSMSNHKSRLNKTPSGSFTPQSRQFKSYFSFQETDSSINQSSDLINPSQIDALKTMHPSNRNMNLCLLPKQESDNIRKEELIYDSFYADSKYFKRKNFEQLRLNESNGPNLQKNHSRNPLNNNLNFKNKHYFKSNQNSSNHTSNVKRHLDSKHDSINIDNFSKRPRHH